MQNASAVIEIDTIVRESAEVVAVQYEVGTLPEPIKIDNRRTMEMAMRRVTFDDAAMKTVHERLDNNKKRARQVWQDWNDLINELCDPFEKDKAYHVAEVRRFTQEEKRKAEAEEARLREETRKLEEERILAEAAELEREGRHEEADEVIAAPVQVIAPTVRADVPKFDARTFRPPTGKARVINKPQFVAWVAASPDRLDLVIENERALNAKAKSLGKSLNIPGVEYYEV